MIRKAEEIVNFGAGTADVSRQALTEVDEAHVAILLALYNGGGTLADQLESIAGQTHTNWSLIVSDDGSSDDGPTQVLAFAKHLAQTVRLIDGPGQGFVRNFLHLLQAAGPAVPFAALSDQDDAWLPGKVDRALSLLCDVPSGRPALYAGRTIICDAALKPLRKSPRFDLPPSFNNALVQSIGGGNTMVLNRAALDLAQETARHAGGVVAHDWWLYQLVSGAGGHIVYDPEPMVLYRQHGSNLIGANDTLIASGSRLAQLLRGRFRTWNSANLKALEACHHFLTPESRKTLLDFRQMRQGTLNERRAALRRAQLYRQTRRGNIALSLAAAMNRV